MDVPLKSKKKAYVKNMNEINIGKKRKKRVLNTVILRGGVLLCAQKAKSRAKNVLRRHALWK